MRAIVLLTCLCAGLMVWVTPIRAADGSDPPTSFLNPTGIAVSKHSAVFVLDSGHARVVRLTSSGRYVTSWGKNGSGPGEFGKFAGSPDVLQGPAGPAALAIGGSGNVFVADTWNDRVEKFSPRGKLLASWDKLSHPIGIAVDSRGFVYVANLKSNTIQRFDSAGKLDATWDHLGPDEKHPGSPLSVAIGPGDSVYATVWYTGGTPCDPQSGKCGPAPETWQIQQRSASGDLSASWKWEGCIPYYDFAETACPIAVGGSGNIFVTDTINPTLNQIRKYTPDGHLVNTWGRSGKDAGQFSVPSGLAVDREGNIYVADTFNNRVQKLSSSGQVLAVWK